MSDKPISKVYLVKQLQNYEEEIIEKKYALQTVLMEKVEGIETSLDSKTDINHKHVISDITDYEVPDLSDYVLKTEIPDTSNFVEKEEGKGLFSGSYNDLTNKPNIPSVEGLVSEDVLNETLSNYIKTDELPDSYDDTELSNRVKTIEDDYVKQADIPTSLPASDVYDWAKEENKPTYTASEVGAEDSGTASTLLSEHNTSTVSHNDIRELIIGLTNRFNVLANSDDATLDQMSEIVEYIKDNRELIESITTTKINISDIVNDLVSNVSNKPLSASQGVVIKNLIDELQTELDKHIDNTTVHITSTERTNWNSAYTHSTSSHAPSNAEANQNAFSNIIVGSTTIAADSKTDSLTLVAGSNVTLTPDATNDKITIAATDTTYSVATTTANGLMSSTDKSKLDGIATGAQVNSITGVKGSAESSYRTGQVSISPENIGLENVPNVTTNNQTPTYTMSPGIAELTSGETLSTAFGKIAKAIRTLVLHITDKNNPHDVTKEQLGITGNGESIPEEVNAHISNTSNPHNVTKSQVGLSNVPNVTTNNQTPTYTEATDLEELISGETLSVAFSKLSAAVLNLIWHINNRTNPHNVTKEQIGLAYVDDTADKDKYVHHAELSEYATSATSATFDDEGNMITLYYAKFSDLFNHEANTDNPHIVTKEQIGLGNVENVSVNNQVPTFTTAEHVDFLYSGETLSDILGRIAKVIEVLVGTDDDAGTLRAGSTTITLGKTSNPDCTIDVYTDVYGVNPTNVVLNWDDNTNTGNVTVTFDPLDYDLGVKVRCF